MSEVGNSTSGTEEEPPVNDIDLTLKVQIHSAKNYWGVINLPKKVWTAFHYSVSKVT